MKFLSENLKAKAKLKKYEQPGMLWKFSEKCLYFLFLFLFIYILFLLFSTKNF